MIRRLLCAVLDHPWTPVFDNGTTTHTCTRCHRVADMVHDYRNVVW